MRVHIKSIELANVQLNARAKQYYNQYITNNNKVTHRGNIIAEILASGFGWYKIVATGSKTLSVALQLLVIAMRKYKNHFNSEMRALILHATGLATITSARVTNTPFVQYTLNIHEHLNVPPNTNRASKPKYRELFRISTANGPGKTTYQPIRKHC